MNDEQLKKCAELKAGKWSKVIGVTDHLLVSVFYDDMFSALRQVRDATRSATVEECVKQLSNLTTHVQ